MSRCLAARQRPETATATGENVFLLARAANFAREQIEGRVAPLRGHLIAIPRTADNETFWPMGKSVHVKKLTSDGISAAGRWMWDAWVAGRRHPQLKVHYPGLQKQLLGNIIPEDFSQPAGAALLV